MGGWAFRALIFVASSTLFLLPFSECKNHATMTSTPIQLDMNAPERIDAAVKQHEQDVKEVKEAQARRESLQKKMAAEAEAANKLRVQLENREKQRKLQHEANEKRRREQDERVRFVQLEKDRQTQLKIEEEKRRIEQKLRPWNEGQTMPESLMDGAEPPAPQPITDQHPITMDSHRQIKVDMNFDIIQAEKAAREKRERELAQKQKEEAEQIERDRAEVAVATSKREAMRKKREEEERHQREVARAKEEELHRKQREVEEANKPKPPPVAWEVDKLQAETVAQVEDIWNSEGGEVAQV